MSEHMHHGMVYGPVDKIPYRHMTEYMAPCRVQGPEGPGAGETQPSPEGSGIPQTQPCPDIPGAKETQPYPDMNRPAPLPTPGPFPGKPKFKVPANPLLPPGYRETLDYESIQYLNGFLRSQIGKYISVIQLIGSEIVEDQHGYLVGVGLNYILLQEIETGNIMALDYYTLKEVYIYHNEPKFPRFSKT